jgi:hypothetical protein
MNTQPKSCDVLVFFLGAVWLTPWLSAVDLSAREAPEMTSPCPAGATPTTAPAVIPWSQLSAKAVAGYRGDGLAITPTPEGARLKCVFQRLEAEATIQGLWLTSTVTNQAGDRFQVKAVAVGRRASEKRGASERESVEPTFQAQMLSSTRTVSAGAQTVRFIRPGLIEEYSVSMDGVRQDFVVTGKPPGVGELQVGLAVAGARVEAMPGHVRPVRDPGQMNEAEHGKSASRGVRLVLNPSGRQLVYNRMRATDATGRELAARIEVRTSNSQSKKQKAEMSQSLLTSAATENEEAATEGTLVVVVQDEGAVYPVRIDPTFSDANWVSLNPSMPGADNLIRAIAVDGSGNVYVGGDFSVIGTVAANHIAKWNGNAWSALGTGMNSKVVGLAVSGTNLYAGGAFTTAGGVTANYIAKWDGRAWSALGAGMNNYVYALAVSGTNLYAGGIFIHAGGVTANYIARWNGSAWAALGAGMGGGEGSQTYVFALAASGTDLYAGGNFTAAGGIAATNIAGWNGSAWSPLGAGMNSYVMGLAISGTNLYAAGDFTTAGGFTANYVAKWNGSAWSAMGAGMNSVAYTVAASATDVYAAGFFTMAGGVEVNSIAKWSGSAWSALGTGMDSSVSALAVSGTTLYAGGSFLAAGEVRANHITAWDGSAWSALGSGMDSDVYALAVSGSDLYAGGAFTTVGGSAANYVAKWNGSFWSALGSGVNEPVYALAVSGSDLYAAGGFTTAGGIAARNIARWNGIAWSALSSGLSGIAHPFVGALAVSGPDLYAGGSFTAAGGIAATNIAKWNGSA